MQVCFNELQLADGRYRPFATALGDWLSKTDSAKLATLNQQARERLAHKGVTFNVYQEGRDEKRTIPFDIIPRLITQQEWRTVQRGCEQRIRALNAFLHDIYHDQAIIKAGIVPANQVFANTAYEPWMLNIALAKPIYSHVSGIDLIRDANGQFCVLEDNLRTPSGVSYLLEARETSKQLLKEVYDHYDVLEVADYPARLKASLLTSSNTENPQLVVLTPGPFNSAYYEHVFLARAMDVPLVSGHDLVVEDNHVYAYTINGKQPVDVIYRRIDDGFLDPLAFRSDSVLGVAGLMGAYLAGNVVIANAPGAGVADDKSLYPYVPKMIEFYLGEQAILPNIKTYQCRDPKQRDYVLANLATLVVKQTQGSGGYGMLIGQAASQAEIAAYRKRILANPAGFIAQPTIALSTNPTFVGNGIAPRHIDLRPFVLSHGDGHVEVIAGGLTRVAMTEGSLVVNSSQGGGVKDTWVIAEHSEANLPAASQMPFSAQTKDNPITPSKPALLTSNLLLSQANNLVWLGRYGERFHHYQTLIKALDTQQLPPQQLDGLRVHLGSTLPAEATALSSHLREHGLPQVLTSIDLNIQMLKSLLSPNLVNRYQSLFKPSLPITQVHLPDCETAIQHEAALVQVYWRFGMLIERLYNQIRLQQNWHVTAQTLVETTQQLPGQLPWQAVIDLAKTLVRSGDTSIYWHLNKTVTALLSDGTTQ